MAAALRILLRPSTAVRGFWLAIAALHLAIFCKRLADGGWVGGLSQVRLVLLIAATIYGAAKTWSAARWLDGPPRKIASFILLMILGHFAVSARPWAAAGREAIASVDWSEVAMAAPPLLAAALACGAAALARNGRLNGGARAAAWIAASRPVTAFESHLIRSRFQRPPPRRA